MKILNQIDNLKRRELNSPLPFTKMSLLIIQTYARHIGNTYFIVPGTDDG